MILDNLKTTSLEPEPAKENIKSMENPIFNPYEYKGSTSEAKAGKNGNYAYNYFKKRGVPSHVAAGLIGNLQQESGVRPLTYDDGANGPGGGGVAQWSPTRFKGLKQFAGANKKDANNLDTQLDYILHELDTTERKAKDRIYATKDAASAAVAFQDTYFRPNKRMANTQARVAAATSLPQYKMGGRRKPKFEFGGEGPGWEGKSTADTQGGMGGFNAVGAGLALAGSMIDATQTSTPNKKKTVGASTLGMAGQGAALGTTILPGWGTAVGAVVGAGVGLFTGNAKAKKQQKEFDKTNMIAQTNFRANQDSRSAMLYRQANPYSYRYGGKHSFTPEFEVEKGEIMRGQFALSDGKKIASNIYDVGGTTHDVINPKTGSYGVLGAGEGDIYSNSLYIGKHTPAQLARKAAKQLAANEKNAQSQHKDKRVTALRNIKLLNEDLDNIFVHQESMKELPKMKWGGKIYGYNTWEPVSKENLPVKKELTRSEATASLQSTMFRPTSTSAPAPAPKKVAVKKAVTPADPDPIDRSEAPKADPLPKAIVQSKPAPAPKPAPVAAKPAPVAVAPKPTPAAKPVAKAVSAPSGPPVSTAKEPGLFEKLSYAPAYLSRLKDIYVDSGAPVKKSILQPKTAVTAKPAPIKAGVKPKAAPVPTNVIDGQAMVSTDSVSLNKDAFAVSQVIDLNKIKGGARNRGEKAKGKNLFASTFHPFTDKLNPNDDYIRVQKDGSMSIGKPDANTVKGSWTAPTKVSEITDEFMDSQNYYKFPVTRDSKGNKDHINISKKGDSADVNDKTAGGAVVFVTPDGKNQYVVRGSVNQVKDTFNKIKSKHKVGELNMYKLDNGSYSSGLFKKNGVNEKDLSEWDKRNIHGGHGLMQYKYGGRRFDDGGRKKSYREIKDNNPFAPFVQEMVPDNTRVARPLGAFLQQPMSISERRARRRALDQQPAPAAPAKAATPSRGVAKTSTPKKTVTPATPVAPKPWAGLPGFDRQIRGDLRKPTGVNPVTPNGKNTLDPVGKMRNRFNPNYGLATRAALIGTDYFAQQAAINKTETRIPVNLNTQEYYGYKDNSRLARHNLLAASNTFVRNPNVSIGQKQQVFARTANSMNEINAQENQARGQYDQQFADQQFRIQAQNNATLNNRNMQEVAARNEVRSASADNFSNLLANVNTLAREENTRKLDQQRLGVVKNAYKRYGSDFVNERSSYGQ